MSLLSKDPIQNQWIKEKIEDLTKSQEENYQYIDELRSQVKSLQIENKVLKYTINNLNERMTKLIEDYRFLNKGRTSDLGMSSRMLGVLTELLYSEDISQETRQRILQNYPSYRKKI